MALTKEQKARLKADGFRPDDLKAIEKHLAEPDEDEDDRGSRRARRSSNGDAGEVAILRGGAAARFLDQFGLGSKDEDEGDDSKKSRRSRDSDDDDDDEEEDDEDEPRKTKWFG